MDVVSAFFDGHLEFPEFADHVDAAVEGGDGVQDVGAGEIVLGAEVLCEAVDDDAEEARFAAEGAFVGEGLEPGELLVAEVVIVEVAVAKIAGVVVAEITGWRGWWFGRRLGMGGGRISVGGAAGRVAVVAGPGAAGLAVGAGGGAGAFCGKFSCSHDGELL